MTPSEADSPPTPPSGDVIASLPTRLAAAGVDLTVLVVPGLIVSQFGFALSSTAGWVLTGVALLAGLAYFARLEGGKGQTIGKRLGGIVVVDATTGRGPVGVRRGWVRAIGRLVGHLTLVGLAWMIVDRRRQPLHDKLARTVVVNLEQGLY